MFSKTYQDFINIIIEQKTKSSSSESHISAMNLLKLLMFLNRFLINTRGKVPVHKQNEKNLLDEKRTFKLITVRHSAAPAHCPVSFYHVHELVMNWIQVLSTLTRCDSLSSGSRP